MNSGQCFTGCYFFALIFNFVQSLISNLYFNKMKYFVFSITIKIDVMLKKFNK